jgi:hypothetical protein
VHSPAKRCRDSKESDVDDMAGEIHGSAGLGSAPKQSVYKELRQNPYLLGLSAVSIPRHT